MIRWQGGKKTVQAMMGDMSEGPVTCRLARQEEVFISCPRHNHAYLNNLKGCGYG